MMNILHRIGIQATASKVFAALATIDGLAGWWTEDTTGSPTAGGHVAFRFRTAAGDEIGGFGMDVIELVPGHKVHWQVKEGPAEWIGTDIEFLLSQDDGYTIVTFCHCNWRAEGEFFAHCSTKWATYLLSLRDLVETGQGKPSPNDVMISNWH